MHKVAVIIPKYGLTGGAEQFASELTGRFVSSALYGFHVYAHPWQESSGPASKEDFTKRKNKNGFIVKNASDAAFPTAAQNTWDSVTEKYVALYEEILDKKS